MKFEFPNAYQIPNKPVTDRWYGKTILRVYGSMLPFKTGQKVLIKSPLYSGVHTIGYIYKGLHATKGRFYNLYFEDIKFIGDTSGTIDTDISSIEKAAPKGGFENENKKLTIEDASPGKITPVNRVQPEKTNTMLDNEIVQKAQSYLQNKWIKYLLYAIAIIIIIRIIKK